MTNNPNEANNVVKVQWPGGAVQADSDDLAPPLRSLLENLRVLETVSAESTGVKLREGTPQSLQVLTAGSTSITKLYTALATVVGGSGALVAGLRTFWGFDGSPADQAFQRAAFMLGAAILGSAVVLAVSIMVRGDVLGRVQAQAATYSARADVASAFVSALGSAMPIPKAPDVTPYVIKIGETWKPVKAFEWDGGLVAVTADDRVPASEMSGLLQSTKLQASS